MPVDFNKYVLEPCIGTFGEPVTYIPYASPRLHINGVFDEAYRELILDDNGTAVTVVMPVLGVKLIDFPNPPLQSDHLFARNKTYIVREVRIDGHGGAKLMLNLDSDYIWP